MEYIFEDELYHHGIKGMHWGVRRYQNADGSYTPAGRIRYGISSNGRMSLEGKRNLAKDNMKIAKKEAKKSFNKMYNRAANHPIATNFTKKGKKKYEDAFDKAYEDEIKYVESKERYKQANDDYKRKAFEEYREHSERSTKYEKRSEKIMDEAFVIRKQKMGKNWVERTMAAIKNETEDAKKYDSLMEKSIDLDIKSASEAVLADEAYRKLGKTKVTRALNAYKYAKSPKEVPDFVSPSKSDKAARARYEAEKAKKLANKYTNSMDKKAEKRTQQAEGRPDTSYEADRAARARYEAEAARTLANKYTHSMTKKAEKRQKQLDRYKEKRYESINGRTYDYIVEQYRREHPNTKLSSMDIIQNYKRNRK